MIVIATNNGAAYLPNLLKSVDGVEAEIKVVDTGSSDPESFLLCDSIGADRCPGSYCIGAYLYAMEAYRRDWYFFMHDSMVVKDRGFLSRFRELGEAVGWLSFPMAFDSPAQESYVRSFWPKLPELGCFGPVFYATRKALDQVDIPIPATSDQSHGLERGVAAAFSFAGIPLRYLDEYDTDRMEQDEYGIFTKIRPKRP